MPATLPESEYESNNTQSTADSLSNGIAMIGSISSSSDIDYFCYTTPSTVPSGVVNLDISLSVPSNQRIKMEVSCAQNSYNISKTSAKGTGIHLRIENASLGSKYYIKISNFSGLTGGNYYLTVNQDIKDAWYGQFYSTLGSVDYWNPNGLDTVKFKYGTNERPVFVQGNGANTQDWMEGACGIVSSAMVLRNKGKTYHGYDFRTKYNGDMMADPYTVMLANFGLDGSSVKGSSSGAITSSCGHSPDYIVSSTIATAFGTTTQTKRYFDASGNRISKCSYADIKNYIDSYGYAIVYLSGSSSNHFMVFSGYKSSGTTMANTFYVYDSAASSYSTGANVLLSKTASGYQSKTYEDVLSITAFT